MSDVNVVYTGLSTYGRIQTVMTCVVLVLISIVLIIAGILSLTKNAPTEEIKQNNRKSGIFSLLIGLLILLFVCFWVYWVFHSKTFAAAQGALDLSNEL